MNDNVLGQMSPSSDPDQEEVSKQSSRNKKLKRKLENMSIDLFTHYDFICLIFRYLDDELTFYNLSQSCSKVFIFLRNFSHSNYVRKIILTGDVECDQSNFEVYKKFIEYTYEQNSNRIRSDSITRNLFSSVLKKSGVQDINIKNYVKQERDFELLFFKFWRSVKYLIQDYNEKKSLLKIVHVSRIKNEDLVVPFDFRMASITCVCRLSYPSQSFPSNNHVGFNYTFVLDLYYSPFDDILSRNNKFFLRDCPKRFAEKRQFQVVKFKKRNLPDKTILQLTKCFPSLKTKTTCYFFKLSPFLDIFCSEYVKDPLKFCVECSKFLMRKEKQKNNDILYEKVKFCDTGLKRPENIPLEEEDRDNGPASFSSSLPPHHVDASMERSMEQPSIHLSSFDTSIFNSVDMKISSPFEQITSRSTSSQNNSSEIFRFETTPVQSSSNNVVNNSRKRIRIVRTENCEKITVTYPDLEEKRNSYNLLEKIMCKLLNTHKNQCEESDMLEDEESENIMDNNDMIDEESGNIKDSNIMDNNGMSDEDGDEDEGEGPTDDDEDEDGNDNSQSAIRTPKRKGRPKTKLTDEDLDINMYDNRENIRSSVSRISNVLNREFNDLEYCMEGVTSKQINKNLVFKTTLSFAEQEEISIEGFFKNGRLVEKKKNNVLTSPSEANQLTGKQMVVDKERKKRSTSGYINDVGPENSKKFTRAVRDARNTHKGNLYFAKDPDTGKQCTLIKSPLLIQHEKFNQTETLKRYIEDHFKYFHEAEKRRQMGLKFDNYINININNDESEDTTYIHISAVVLEISDESYTLNKKIKFLAGYIRNMIKRNPMAREGLEPFVYSDKSLNYFKRIRSFEAGYEKLVDEYEKNIVRLDLSHLHSFFENILNEFVKNPKALLGNIKFSVDEVVKYLADLAEARTMALSSLSPTTTRHNLERFVQFLTGDPKFPDSKLIPISKLVTHRLILDVLRGENKTYKKLEEIPFAFSRPTDLNCLHRKKNADDFFMDMLHLFFSKERVDRKFFLEHFLPAVFYYWSSGRSDRDWRKEYVRFLRLLIFFGLVNDGGAIKFQHGNHVEFGSDLSFGNQKTNMRFYDSMSDSSYPLTKVLEQTIADIGNQEVQKLLLDIHGHIKDLFHDMIKFQNIVYKSEYYNMKDLDDLVACADDSDYKRDTISCYVLGCFSHYRSFELENLVLQAVRSGRLVIFDIQNVENGHKSIKWRHYCQMGYTTSQWTPFKAANIADTEEIEDLSKQNMQALSFFMIYEKVKNDDRYSFISPEDWQNAKYKYLKLGDEKYEIPRPELIRGGRHTGTRPTPTETEQPPAEQTDFTDNDPIDPALIAESSIELDTSPMIGEEQGLQSETLSTPETMYSRSQAGLEDDISNKDRIKRFCNETKTIDNDDIYHQELDRKRKSFEELIVKFVHLLDGVDFNLDLCGNITLENMSDLQHFSFEMLPEVEFNYISLTQKADVESIVRKIFETSRSLLGAEMGYGKTRILITVILLLLFNDVAKHVVFVSKGDIIIQWIDSIIDICTNQETGISLIPPKLYRHNLASKDDKDIVVKDFIASGGILFTTQASMKNFSKYGIDQLRSNPRRFVFVYDESHYLISMGTSFDRIIDLTSSPNCITLFSTGTLLNETIQNTKTQICAYTGKRPDDIQIRDIRNCTDIRGILGDTYIRRRISYNFNVSIFIISLVMDSTYRTYYLKFLEDKKVSHSISSNDTWMSRATSHSILNCSVNGFDLLLRAQGYDYTKIQPYLDVLELDVKKVGFFSPVLNPKLFAILAFCSKVISLNDSGIIFSNSLPFLNYIKDALHFISKDNQYNHIVGKVIFLSGAGMSATKRQKEIARFKKNEGPMIIVTMMGISESGLNLQKANHILIATVPRIAIGLLQMIYRIIRPYGQLKDCTITQLLFHDSVEHQYFNRFVLPRLRNLHQLQDEFDIGNEQIENLPLLHRQEYPPVVVCIVNTISEHVRGVIKFEKQLLGSIVRQ